MNFEKPPEVFGSREESEISPNRHVFVFIVGREIEKIQAAINVTNAYLLFLEYRVPNKYFDVENDIRASQTRVILNTAVGRTRVKPIKPTKK